MEIQYNKIAEHYDNCYKEYGDSHLGVNWPNYEDTLTRHEVMLGVIKKDYKCSILDFGCGLGHFYEYLKKTGNLEFIDYSGLDINKDMILKCKEKYPYVNFFSSNIHRNTFDADIFDIYRWDYIIMNGVFTVKGALTQAEMNDFFASTLDKVWEKAKKGIVFNCMSKVLDYEREDLFHVGFDTLSKWIYDNLSPNFTFRQDYGLREFTCYVYK
jgi:SAM-dependent methyltransferase